MVKSIKEDGTCIRAFALAPTPSCADVKYSTNVVTPLSLFQLWKNCHSFGL